MTGDTGGGRYGDRQKDQGGLILLGHGVKEGKRVEQEASLQLLFWQMQRYN